MRKSMKQREQTWKGLRVKLTSLTTEEGCREDPADSKGGFGIRHLGRFLKRERTRDPNLLDYRHILSFPGSGPARGSLVTLCPGVRDGPLEMWALWGQPSRKKPVRPVPCGR